MSTRQRLSGAKPGSGHYEEFLAHPALLMLRAWRECGDFAEFDLDRPLFISEACRTLVDEYIVVEGTDPAES